MTKEPNMKEPIKIELTSQQALVLFDWVKRFNERKVGSLKTRLRSGCWPRPVPL